MELVRSPGGFSFSGHRDGGSTFGIRKGIIGLLSCDKSPGEVSSSRAEPCRGPGDSGHLQWDVAACSELAHLPGKVTCC